MQYGSYVSSHYEENYWRWKLPKSFKAFLRNHKLIDLQHATDKALVPPYLIRMNLIGRNRHIQPFPYKMALEHTNISTLRDTTVRTQLLEITPSEACDMSIFIIQKYSLCSYQQLRSQSRLLYRAFHVTIWHSQLLPTANPDEHSNELEKVCCTFDSLTLQSPERKQVRKYSMVQ